MVGNCDATNGAGLSNAPTHGWDSSADCSFAMNICSPPTGPSSISLASGSRCGNVYETRSSKLVTRRVSGCEPMRANILMKMRVGALLAGALCAGAVAAQTHASVVTLTPAVVVAGSPELIRIAAPDAAQID